MADQFDQGRYAYVTLLSTENYLDAVLVLNKSLQKVNAKYPLVVMVTKNIYSSQMEEIFKSHGLIAEPVEPLFYSEETQQEHAGATVLNTASKLQLFTLKNWDKLVYIDADSLVIKNIDDLFEYPDGSMLKYPEDNMGFSGLFVFYPRNHQEDEFYPTIMKHHKCVDGDLLGKLWFYIRESKAHQIDFNYFWHYSPFGCNSDVKAVHYCNPIKPWLEPEHAHFADGSYINHLYQKILKEIRESLN